MLFDRDRVTRTGKGRYEITLRRNERVLVAELVGQLREQLLASTDDPSVRRLFPPAYPDDAERDAGYQVLTRDELLEHKLAALDTVEATLGAGGLGTVDLDPDRLDPGALDTAASDEAEPHTGASGAGEPDTAASDEGEPDTGASDEGEPEPVVLDEEAMTAWMTALNSLRLVLGTRLDAGEEPPRLAADHPLAPAYAVYEVLGWLLSQVVDALSGDLPPPNAGPRA